VTTIAPPTTTSASHPRTPAGNTETMAQDEKKQRARSLEHALETRPDVEELKQKNILKDTTAAPALQEKQAELERKMAADALDQKLQRRPTAEKLVKEGILGEDEIPTEP